MAKKAGKRDPVANFDGVRDDRIKYWSDLLKRHKEKKYLYRDEEGKEKEADIKATASDLGKVAEQLAEAEVIGLYYDNRGRELREAAMETTSKLEKETEKALHDFLEKNAKELDHPDLVGRGMKDFYGTLLQMGPQMQIGENEVKKLLHYAQKNTKKGRESRANLIDIMSSHARTTKINRSNLYHTRHIKESDLDKITAYKHAAAIGANTATHGHYSPNIDNILTLDDARNLLDTTSKYLMNPESPHKKSPTQSAFYTKSKAKEKKKARDARDYATTRQQQQRQAAG